MCLGIPGQIIEFVDEENSIAKVEVSGVRRNVNVALVQPDGIATGDWVLIHVGFAMSKIDEQEAQATLDLLRQMGEMYEDELEMLHQSEIE
ncbi:MAG TPA: HypC/HybG/HupF family hydrogenase formation chaperone [Roseiflexaceae bacterium]|nr:HypC/HybG/HupF family hydrogenase formation chaperone [Roseiflexaceae bacterium]